MGRLRLAGLQNCLAIEGNPSSSLIYLVIFYFLPHLVGGVEHFLFFHILGRIIPTGYIIFFGGVETTNQSLLESSLYVYRFLGLLKVQWWHKW